MIKIEVRSTLAAIRAQQVLTVGLVGVPVEFVFGEEWKYLAKTAVFRQEDGSGQSWDVLLTDDRAVIPWAALQQPGLPLRIGVYGVNADGKVVIPTVWAVTEPVRPGTDPQLDASVAPALPVWQQLQGMIGSMDNLETDHKQTLVGAINEANRPVFRVNVYQNTDGSYYPGQTVNQIHQEWMAGKQVVCCIGQMVLQLTSIDESTANFEGIFGKTKYQVCIGNEVNVTTDRFIMQGDRLPSPNALTFTGAVEAEYDGLAPVTVEIPTGGSGVHVGSQEPEDENASLWIDPEEGESLDFVPCPEQGEEGQVLAVKAVDADGKPVRWECTQPNAPFYVTVTENGEGGYVSDTYFPEIKEALDQKRSVYCKLGGGVYHLDSISSRFAVFVSHGAGYYSQLRIGDDASTIILTSPTFIPKPSSAKNGQILQYVVPTHGTAGWVAADLPSGGSSVGAKGWTTVLDMTVSEETYLVRQEVSGCSEYLVFVRAVPGSGTNKSQITFDVYTGSGGGSVERYQVNDAVWNDGKTAIVTQAHFMKPTGANWIYGTVMRKEGATSNGKYAFNYSEGDIQRLDIYTSPENNVFGIGTQVQIFGR